MHTPIGVSIPLPDWVGSVISDLEPITDPSEQMAIVLDLASRNVADGGGPFAAAVFNDDGLIVGVGVNMVVPAAVAIAHAEIMAIATAGQNLGRWDIGEVGGHRLVSSTEPCAMCLGAVPWSGVTGLVCGARDSDARAIGFDEGHKPQDWVANLELAGIAVLTDVRREEGAAVLRSYLEHGGEIYNGDRS